MDTDTDLQPIEQTEGAATETQPVEPAPAFTAADLEAARQEAFRQAAEYLAQPQTQPSTPSDPLDSVAELFDVDPKAAFARMLDLAEERAARKFAPVAERVNSAAIAESLGTGLDETARNYIAQAVKGVDPSQINDVAKDLIVRAARDYSKEQAEARRAKEPAFVPPAIKVNEDAYTENNTFRASMGLQPLTKAEFAQLSEVN